MIQIVQRIVSPGTGRSDDSHVPGDCFKCCVASILELPYEDVPHFVAGEWLVAPRDSDGTVTGPPARVYWMTALNDWLRSTGWALQARSTTYYKNPLPRGPVESEFDWYDPYDAPRNWASGQGYWIAAVISENFERRTHAVVMLDGAVAFDPSTKPRRTPYQFVGETYFIATNPAICCAKIIGCQREAP